MIRSLRVHRGTAVACALALAAGLSGGHAVEGAVASLDDIQFWVGSGSLRAAVVIDWLGDDGSDQSPAWGFRWDGAATGGTMLQAVVAADPRLYAKLGGVGTLGLAVRGLGYDANDDAQFALDDNSWFDEQGFAVSGPADGAMALDGADLYREGWFTGVWNYGVANANPWTGGWTYSPAGATHRPLVDGAWDSWAFTPTFRQSAFAANAVAAVNLADFNSDGSVDGADLLVWQRGLGLSQGVLRATGDASGDGLVDGADLSLWSAHFSPVAADATGASQTLPEPNGAEALIGSLGLFLVIVRRR
ncbi:MAG TPA: hypothetical protein PJ982_00560 [Lacipirellulaceae bacterium]|nr:hypothetical protein [Lacipirellulaceae bacterium]